MAADATAITTSRTPDGLTARIRGGYSMRDAPSQGCRMDRRLAAIGVCLIYRSSTRPMGQSSPSSPKSPEHYIDLRPRRRVFAMDHHETLTVRRHVVPF